MMIRLRFLLLSLFLVLYNASPIYDLKLIDSLPATCQIVRNKEVGITSVVVQERPTAIDKHTLSIEPSTSLFLSGSTLTMSISPFAYVMVGGVRYTSSERHTIAIKGGEQVLISGGGRHTTVTQGFQRNNADKSQEKARCVRFVIKRKKIMTEHGVKAVEPRRVKKTNSNVLGKESLHPAATADELPNTIPSEPSDETNLLLGGSEPTLTRVDLSLDNPLLGDIIKGIDGRYAAHVGNNAIGYLMSGCKTRAIQSGGLEELPLRSKYTYILLLAEVTEDSKLKVIYFLSLLTNVLNRNLGRSIDGIIAVARGTVKYYKKYESYKERPGCELNFGLSMVILTNRQAEECNTGEARLHWQLGKFHFKYLSQEQEIRSEFNLPVGNYDVVFVEALKKISPNILRASDDLVVFTKNLIRLIREHNEMVDLVVTESKAYERIPLPPNCNNPEDRSIKGRFATFLRLIVGKTIRDMAKLIDEAIMFERGIIAQIGRLRAECNVLEPQWKNVDPQNSPTFDTMSNHPLLSTSTEHFITVSNNPGADSKTTAKTSKPSIITARLSKAAAPGEIAMGEDGKYFAHSGPDVLGYLISNGEGKVVPSNEPEELTRLSDNPCVLLLAKPTEETKLRAVHFLALLANVLKRHVEYSAETLRAFADRIISHYMKYGPYLNNPRYTLDFGLSISIISRNRQTGVEKTAKTTFFNRILQFHLQHLHQEQQIRKAFGMSEGNYDESLLEAVLRVTEDVHKAKSRVNNLSHEIHDLVCKQHEIVERLKERNIQFSDVVRDLHVKGENFSTSNPPLYILRRVLGIKSQDLTELINKAVETKAQIVAENNRLWALYISHCQSD